MVEFPPLRNDLLLRAARGEKTERAPVWIMRQAGRYLPEFRALRANHEFFEICRTPDLATEITLQPIRRYSGLIDASIIFSDILVIPQALGMEVLMNPGPSFPDPLVTPADVAKLREKVDVDKELGYVFKAITQTRIGLKGEVPLIGFCGAPWTLFAYMIEGGGSKTFTKAKTWLFKYPGRLLQVFDSWAGELSPHDFALFSLPTLKHISKGVHEKLSHLNIPQVPMTLFAKGANYALGDLSKEAGYDPAEARDIVKGKVALQGNMDPNVLYGGREAIESAVKRMCEGFKKGNNGEVGAWIANLGHGITPGVDPEDVKWFFECVHKYSAGK
ncbi:uroporphyrinogen decarboxylase [Gymnopus androsaceus JB14]|uniref:uroporphyrinogen decarboxylase n=1 Tax=Gymnopus androsaceus JB14 TaxID=1447944 RepID=A0A6A4I244_9AGAR|nr:uroporphyrinogen decarboxylase [Gymnopus androsaceus JB14]